MSGVAVRVLAADVLARLQGMEERGGNLSGVMRNFGSYMVGSIQKNFDAEGRPTRWTPLAAGTLAGWMGSKKSFWNKKRTDLSKTGKAALAGRKVLTASTRLRNSINYIAATRGVTIGTNVIYGAIHQFGGKAGRGRKVTIPARPYLMFQDEDITYFERSLLAFITTGGFV